MDNVKEEHERAIIEKKFYDGEKNMGHKNKKHP